MTKRCTKINSTDQEILDIKTLTNEIRAKLKGDYPVTKTVLAIGSNKDDVASAAFDFIIGGVQYSKAVITTGTAPGDDVIPEDTFGAVAFDIDAAGTITVAEATDNATGYASAALAIAGIPAVAATKARMGTVTASGAEAAFIFVTTLLDAVDTTVAYTDGQTHFEASGDAVS